MSFDAIANSTINIEDSEVGFACDCLPSCKHIDYFVDVDRDTAHYNFIQSVLKIIPLPSLEFIPNLSF
jgi:hypothetical protein